MDRMRPGNIMNINTVILTIISGMLSLILWASNSWIKYVGEETSALRLITTSQASEIAIIKTESMTHWDETQRTLAAINNKLDRALSK